MMAAELARALGAKRSGNQWSAKCPAHDDKTPSLIFWDGEVAIRFKCYSGCSPTEIIDALRRRGLWEGNGKGWDRPVEHPNVQRSQDQNRERAIEIFREAISISNTGAEYYLAMRGLWVPPELNGRLTRFHPRCPRGSGRDAALVVLMRDIVTDKPAAIQRIFLTRDYKADKKMMLGSAGGAAMKINAGLPITTLTICEGFETGLALVTLGFAPVWALGSAGAIGRFPFIDGVEKLIVAYDNDPPGCAPVWDVKATWGDRMEPITVDQPGMDFADLVQQMHERDKL